MIDLSNKVVLVTGGGGGIGAAIVRKVVQLGGDVVLHDVRTGGKATGSDANAKLNATKNDDITTVRIGEVEVYYVPDAFVFGG